MDVQMPKMDGLTATREICRFWPNSRPRIVGMTAGAMLQDRKACLDAGMDDYVSKPLSWRELQAVLYRCQPNVSNLTSVSREIEAKSSINDSVNDSINWQTLEQIKFLHNDDPDGWLQLVEMFREGSLKRLSLIKESFDTEQISNMRSLAHALKGSTSNLGAMKMAEICNKIEKMPEAEFKKSVKGLIQSLEIEFERVYQVLKNTKV
jgi:CheY-like chemotaxis protein